MFLSQTQGALPIQIQFPSLTKGDLQFLVQIQSLGLWPTLLTSCRSPVVSPPPDVIAPAHSTSDFGLPPNYATNITPPPCYALDIALCMCFAVIVALPSGYSIHIVSPLSSM